jgi:malic enzyme
LGDLGANGMGIPIGKLALYVAAGGINPGRVLPCMIDVGTNNQNLLADPFYLGITQKRITGDEYYKIVDEFMMAVTNRWPNVLVQFEDFTPDKAPAILEKYKDKYLTFNDDIQGTGSVIVSGVLNALRASGRSFGKNYFVHSLILL